MSDLELINHLRLLTGYHMGTDLADRVAQAERCQRQQREALAKAADRLEQLEAEIRACKTSPPCPTL